MIPGGDYDDALDVIDIWLHEYPSEAVWERDECIMPASIETDYVEELRFDHPENRPRFAVQ